MTKSNKNTKGFKDFEGDLTSDYDPPKYLVQPAEGDKGFYMFQKAFKDQKKFFQPFIRSTNKDLNEH
jgi:hypothetical protein